MEDTHKIARNGVVESGGHLPTAPTLPLFEQAHARNSDPKHSHEAAASVTNLGPTRDAILRVLRNFGPSTDEMIWALFEDMRVDTASLHPRVSPSGLRSRRSELVRMGFVVEAGTGKTASGRPCAIWRMK